MKSFFIRLSTDDVPRCLGFLALAPAPAVCCIDAEFFCLLVSASIFATVWVVLCLFSSGNQQDAHAMPDRGRPPQPEMEPPPGPLLVLAHGALTPTPAGIFPLPLLLRMGAALPPVSFVGLVEVRGGGGRHRIIPWPHCWERARVAARGNQGSNAILQCNAIQFRWTHHSCALLTSPFQAPAVQRTRAGRASRVAAQRSSPAVAAAACACRPVPM